DASPSAEAARLAFAFSSINSIVCVFWCVAGSLLAILLRSQASWTVFMRVLAVFLSFSALMVFL
ncbi:MAG: LysE family translocator, partial [Pseudomonadota bacterium]